MKIKILSVLIIGFFTFGLLLVSPVLAGDYVAFSKVKLGGQYADKLGPVWKAWDKYHKDATIGFPEEVAKIRAQIAIAESRAADNDSEGFKKEMKKLKKAPKTLKKLAKKSKLYFTPYELQMK